MPVARSVYRRERMVCRKKDDTEGKSRWRTRAQACRNVAGMFLDTESRNKLLQKVAVSEKHAADVGPRTNPPGRGDTRQVTVPPNQVTKAAEYRREAALCLAAAERMTMFVDGERRVAMARQWLAMGKQWLALADKLEAKRTQA